MCDSKRRRPTTALRGARSDRRSRAPGNRRALAVVELAVCLPVLILLIMGSIEACSMVFVKQSLHVVAYEGVRAAIPSTATTAQVRARCQQILDERHIQGAVIRLTPADVSSARRGQDIVVRVTASAADNAVIRNQFFRNQLEAVAVMVKE